jgi:hypothetical protein
MMIGHEYKRETVRGHPWEKRRGKKRMLRSEEDLSMSHRYDTYEIIHDAYMEKHNEIHETVLEKGEVKGMEM